MRAWKLVSRYPRGEKEILINSKLIEKCRRCCRDIPRASSISVIGSSVESMSFATRQELGSQDTWGASPRLIGPTTVPVLRGQAYVSASRLPRLHKRPFTCTRFRTERRDDAVPRDGRGACSSSLCDARRAQIARCQRRRLLERARSRLQLAIEIYLQVRLARQDNWNAAARLFPPPGLPDAFERNIYGHTERSVWRSHNYMVK